jgi:hypothetical protein
LCARPKRCAIEVRCREKPERSDRITQQDLDLLEFKGREVHPTAVIDQAA